MLNLYFDEPRFKMSVPARSIVRLGTALTYALLGVTAPALIITNINSLKWLGILLALFLLDRFVHFGKGEKSLKDATSSVSPINIAFYLSSRSFSILEHARDRAAVLKGSVFLHLAKFLLEDKGVKTGLYRLDVQINDFLKKVDEGLMNKEIGDVPLEIEKIAKNAFYAAQESGAQWIEPSHLFSGLTKESNPVLSRIYDFFGLKAEDINNAVILGYLHSGRRSFLGFLRLPRRRVLVSHRIMNRAWTARPTPMLDRFSEDLTDEARMGITGFLVGHENEYDDMVRVLSNPAKPNALLVGEPGSGKETIVGHLAREIAKDNIPEALFDRRIVALRLGSLISGAEAEEIASRINRVAEEIIRAGNIILYIPDIHNLVKTSGFFNAADVLLPIIRNDAFPVIGATYPKEYKEFIEPQTEFSSIFEIINVRELSPADSIRYLSMESVILEEDYKTVISFGAIKAAVTVAHKYFRHKLLPSSAADLLKESLADATQRGDKLLQADDVIAIAERKTNIPIHRPGREEAARLLNLESIIHERLIDQEEAVRAVSRSLREYRSGLSRSGGPIAAFLFVGPTGVGKTELAKTLSEIQFGSETMMARFDMSEYQDKQSFFRFIGSPDGRIAGMLTESVIQKPYSLILLDEFEKSHPDILNLFLQVFDDGRLTDNFGRTVDFTNTIVIATSNAHSDFIKSSIEEGVKMEKISEELKKKLADYFRPELLNRFSNITVFKTLSPDDIYAIAKLQLTGLVKSLRDAQNIDLQIDESAVSRVAELGFDPVFGARPLRGVISDKLRGVLAEKILKGELIHGDAARISFENGEFQFKTSQGYLATK